MFLAQFHPNNKDIVLTKCPNLQKYVALMAASRLKALQMRAV